VQGWQARTLPITDKRWAQHLVGYHCSTTHEVNYFI
jgi:hypothetical protein